MAIGTQSAFKIYNEYIHTAMVETLVQNSDAFNAASRGALRLTAVSRRGEYTYESFFSNTANLVSRRVVTGSGATAVVDDTNLSQDEHISVKVNRKIGPVAQTLDAFRKIQQGPFDENALNYAIGIQAAKAMQIEMLDTAIRALVAALTTAGAGVTNYYTVPTNGTMATEMLVRGLAKFGDAAARLNIWVMHSKPFYDLVENQITENIFGVSNFVVASASPVTLNRPVLVTDASALVADGSPDDYYTLALGVDAAVLEDSEESIVHSEIVTGRENLFVRYQGEYAYNLGLKGFKWDVQSGGANPTDNSLGTGSNWDQNMDSHKDLAGVVIQSR